MDMGNLVPQAGIIYFPGLEAPPDGVPRLHQLVKKLAPRRRGKLVRLTEMALQEEDGIPAEILVGAQDQYGLPELPDHIRVVALPEKGDPRTDRAGLRYFRHSLTGFKACQGLRLECIS